jgi:hypothetical protein
VHQFSYKAKIVRSDKGKPVTWVILSDKWGNEILFDFTDPSVEQFGLEVFPTPGKNRIRVGRSGCWGRLYKNQITYALRKLDEDKARKNEKRKRRQEAHNK